MADRALELVWLPGEYAICRLDPGASLPAWAWTPGPLLSITRTRSELSIVASSTRVPPDVRAERGWRAMQVVGPLAFELVGVLARLASALAEAGIPLCAVSTYDTDILLVRADQASRAASALAAVAVVPPPTSASTHSAI